jgi:uncharacterized protein YgiM (DUF1202 family)
VSGARIIRAAVGVIVVVALGFVVMNWWNDYRSTAKSKPSTPVVAPGTPSTVPSSTVAGVAVVKMNGVNFRMKPSSSAKLIRGLKEGEKVTIILQDGQWFKVKDAKGKTGWVTATGGYVVLEEQ